LTGSFHNSHYGMTGSRSQGVGYAVGSYRTTQSYMRKEPVDVYELA